MLLEFLLIMQKTLTFAPNFDNINVYFTNSLINFND